MAKDAFVLGLVVIVLCCCLAGAYGGDTEKARDLADVALLDCAIFSMLM